MAQSEIKRKLIIVIDECFKKAQSNNFKDLNYAFQKNKQPKETYKKKIKALNELDEYSQTFLSIHTRAKIALREFQSIKFDGAYLELLRLVLTLSEQVRGKKSVRVYERDEIDFSIYTKGEIIEPNEKIEKQQIFANTKLIKSGITGKKIKTNKNKVQSKLEDLMDIEFDAPEAHERTNVEPKNELHDLII